MQSIVSSDLQTGLLANRAERWKPAETAIIVCDMWNRRWCDAAAARVADLAPALSEMLAAARRKGVTIVHAPSKCTDFYKHFTQRKQLQKASLQESPGEDEPACDDTKFPNEPADYPVDFSVECETPGSYPHPVWTKQIDHFCPLGENT